MKEEKTFPSFEDTILNLTYLYVSGATYLMQVLCSATKNLDLEGELTKEQKRSLRNDANFTWKSVQYLSKAQADYKTLMKDLDVVESELNKRIKGDLYDYGVANMLDLLSVDISYLTLCCDNDDNSRKIHTYLQKYKLPDDMKQAYDMLQRRAKNIIKNHK